MNVVITGSSKGLGFAIAKEFLHQGDFVVISSRNKENIQSASEKLDRLGYHEKYHKYQCDVTLLKEIEALASFSVEKMGSIDIWINNAGTKGSENIPLIDSSESTLRIPIDTNLIGTLFGTQVALKIMFKQGSGKIFAMEGMGSNGMPSPNAVAYGASKAALPQFLKTMTKELKNRNILIGNLSPGMVLTDLLLNGAKPQNYSIFNILAEKPETVAEFFVPRIKKFNKSGKSITYLTNFKAVIRFLTAWRYKNRWFDKQGMPKF